MSICGFNGKPRSGKTAALACRALYSLSVGRKVFANYELKHPNAKIVEPYDLIDFLEMGEKNPSNSPLFDADLSFQEMQNWLESRLGQDKTNLAIGYFIVQAPKMGFNIDYDCQLNSSVDKRLKQNASARFEAEKRSNGVRYYELDLEHTEENVRTGRKKFLSLDFLRSYVFPYYNTHKVSIPIGFKTLKMQMQKDSPQHMKETIKFQADLIEKNLHLLYDGTRASVEYALIQLGEPCVFSSSVCIELKIRRKARIQQKIIARQI